VSLSCPRGGRFADRLLVGDGHKNWAQHPHLRLTNRQGPRGPVRPGPADCALEPEQLPCQIPARSHTPSRHRCGWFHEDCTCGVGGTGRGLRRQGTRPGIIYSLVFGRMVGPISTSPRLVGHGPGGTAPISAHFRFFPNRRPLMRRAFGDQDVLGLGRPTKPAPLFPDGADGVG
jgi:hypothetical protein